MKINRVNSKNYIIILPILIIVSLFTIYPILYAVIVSFQEYTLIKPGPYPFVGFLNYLEVIKENYFLQALFNTIWFSLSCVVLTTVIGFIVALFLSQNIRGKELTKIVMFLPWTVPYVAVGIVWKLFFTSEWGYLTKILRVLGILAANRSPAWLINPIVARIGVIIAQVWHEVPLATIFFLAGLQTIPKELYDAVKVDGGGYWVIIQYVMLPLLKPIFMIVIILNALMAMITFDVVYIMTGGGPAGKTSLLSYYGYAKAFKFLNFGEGGAISIVLTLIIIILVYSLFKISSFGG